MGTNIVCSLLGCVSLPYCAILFMVCVCVSSFKKCSTSFGPIGVCGGFASRAVSAPPFLLLPPVPFLTHRLASCQCRLTSPRLVSYTLSLLCKLPEEKPDANLAQSCLTFLQQLKHDKTKTGADLTLLDYGMFVAMYVHDKCPKSGSAEELMVELKADNPAESTFEKARKTQANLLMSIMSLDDSYKTLLLETSYLTLLLDTLVRHSYVTFL